MNYGELLNIRMVMIVERNLMSVQFSLIVVNCEKLAYDSQS